MNELGSVLGIGIAFVGGVVSFASPCCLPLVPAYLAYMVGATGEGTTGRRPAFLHGLSFVLGFSLVFVAFWAVIGALGVFLDRRVLNIAGGTLLVDVPDRRGRAAAIAGAYRTMGIPTHFFIGADGKIREVRIGALPRDEMDRAVAALMN